MDMTASIEPKSDQLNSDSLISGPRTFTIAEVSEGNPEQPVNVELVESPGKPYRPSKSMRRVLVAAWGKEASAYAGHRITLYRNPDIKFGGIVVGGIEISNMTGIDKPISVPLTVTRGKKKMHKVDPIIEAAPRDWAAEIGAADLDGLRELWSQVPAEFQPKISEKVAALKETGADA